MMMKYYKDYYHHDIIDVIEEEATEDIMKLAGTSETEEELEEEKCS